MRAFVITICFCVIGMPVFSTLETAFMLVDFLFVASNCRGDDKCPGLPCLTACYLALFGEYAEFLLNEQVSFKTWLTEKGDWQHIWTEPISSLDAPDLEGTSLAIPSHLSTMVNHNQLWSTTSRTPTI